MSDPFLKAIHDWVKNSSGLVADSAGRGPVIWSGQKAPRPNAPYIALTLLGDQPVAQDWMTVEDVAPEEAEPGADLEFTMVGPRSERLRIECFAAEEVWASVRPERVLRRVIAARRLPSHAQALRAAGIGLGPVGQVNLLAIDRAQLFEPRVQVEIALHTISEISERGTWIERVEIESEVSGITLPTVIVPPEE